MMMQEQTGGIFVRLLEVAAALLPGAVGSAFSLNFIPGTKRQKGIAFLLGVACAGYLGGWLIEYLAIKPGSPSAGGISFAIGLFGFAIVLHATQQIPEIFKALLEWFKNTLGKLTPGGK